MANISRPTLPPKAGYVEVIENGEHVYRETDEAQTLRLAREIISGDFTFDDIVEYMGDLEYRLCLVELGVNAVDL